MESGLSQLHRLFSDLGPIAIAPQQEGADLALAEAVLQREQLDLDRGCFEGSLTPSSRVVIVMHTVDQHAFARGCSGLEPVIPWS
jgi:hypothetical protein